MQHPGRYGDVREDPHARSPVRRTAADVGLVVGLLAAVVAIGAHAPSNLYAYAQLKRIGTAIGMLTSGDWLLPINQTGRIASKPQLYPWLTAAALKLTGAYNDFVFRLPTVVAAVATAVCVYFLARRWYGRRVALLAGCLWATALHMSRLAYLAATDMLLTLWVTVSVMCADRLLFHRGARAERWKWAVGLWASMILAALAKGWGVVNLVLVGGMLALASVLGPGFPGLRAVKLPVRCFLAGRLVLRRLRRAMRAVWFGWGLLAMAAVLVPLWIAMFARGGEEFRQLIYFEFLQRATGAGEGAPKAGSAPAILYLVYYLLPASVFAVGALAVTPLREWFSRKGPFCLPLCWIVAVVLPFSLAHGFRPDYLLPCYAGGAILGAWGVEAVFRGRRGGKAAVRALRHVFAAVAIAMSLAVGGIATGYALRDHLGESVGEVLKAPAVVAPGTWWVVYALIVIGLGGAALGTVWSLQWRLRRVVAIAMVSTLGVMFLHTHMISRHARSGDGEAMIAFSREAGPVVGDDEIAVFRTEKLSVELYLGRLGVRAGGAEDINRSAPAWLITCDRGLTELGACREDPNGSYVLKVKEQTGPGRPTRKARLRTLPEELGIVRATGRAIVSQNWGRIYLIELRRPVRISGKPMRPAWVSGKRDEDG